MDQKEYVYYFFQLNKKYKPLTIVIKFQLLKNKNIQYLILDMTNIRKPIGNE